MKRKHQIANVWVAASRPTRTVEAVVGSHRDRLLAADPHWRLATLDDVRRHHDHQLELARRAAEEARAAGPDGQDGDEG